MLQQVGEELWVADHDFKMMGIALGMRTTVIRLGDGGLFLHAPGPLSPELTDAINALGPVRCLVAPNDFHHLFVEENQRTWPDASVHVSAGLPAKRPDLASATVLGDTPAGLWEGEIEQVWMRGAPKVNEVVFFHPLSRTLVLTDLAFNFVSPGSFRVRIFLRINGASGRLATSRLLKSMHRDRASARVSAEKIFDWDFDRIVLCHGDVVEADAKAKLQAELAWLLDS
jgi:hypothetical protein